MSATHQVNANVLDCASLFLYVATPADIEAERQRLEAERGELIAVFDIAYPTHSGARCTRVTWREA
jgi:hypothetical protein